MKHHDILWHHSDSGEIQLWFMDGHRLVNRAAVVDENDQFIPILPPFSIVAAGDFNGDGKVVPVERSLPRDQVGVRNLLDKLSTLERRTHEIETKIDGLAASLRSLTSMTARAPDGRTLINLVGTILNEVRND